jgi:hypothetical protein
LLFRIIFADYFAAITPLIYAIAIIAIFTLIDCR